MLRLIHTQLARVPGAIFIDDIDDGLPNKEVHRMGSTADPKAYVRDGYANKPKQPSYVPRTKIYPVIDATLPGYIDLEQTDKVTLSAGKGKIFKLQQLGYIRIVSFVASDLNTPAITTAQIGAPGAGDLTITGTKLLSLSPNTSYVLLTGTGCGAGLTLSMAQILAAGGVAAFIDTSIVIPAALIPGISATTTFAQVKADDKLSSVIAVTV